MMLNELIKNDFNKLMVGSKLIEIKRYCDLICLTFRLSAGKELDIHAQCFLRVFYSDNTLIICSHDMLYSSPRYKFKKYERFNWTVVGSTLFDDSVDDYKDKLFSTEILYAKFEDKDIRIGFKNDMRMDIFVNGTKNQDSKYVENYRIFGEDENEKHFVV